MGTCVRGMISSTLSSMIDNRSARSPLAGSIASAGGGGLSASCWMPSGAGACGGVCDSDAV